MIARADEWLFSPHFDRLRRARLESVTSFDAVIARIDSEMHNVTVRVCDGCDPALADCHRPVLAFELAPHTFDAFFNSPVGYRAQFLAEPNVGQAANGRLLGRLLGKLLSAASSSSELSTHQLELSLIAVSAKIWVQEDDFPFLHLTEDLAVTAWVAAAKAGHEKARWGLCAPAGSKLEVKGVFLDPAGNEMVPSDKIGRRFEIAKYGFS